MNAGQVMAVGTRPSNKVHWLVVDSEQEVDVSCVMTMMVTLSCCRCRTG